MTTKYTQDDAQRMAVEHENEVLGALKTRAELRTERVSECDDPTDGVMARRVVVSRTSRLHERTPDAALFDELLDYWRERDRAVLDDSRPTDAQMLLRLEDPADGFRITLQSNDLGVLTLITTSPCVWPSGAA